MNDEVMIIEKLLSEMAGVMNVLPGETFRMKNSDTLLILQRRMDASDLKNALVLFNEIFTCTSGVTKNDLCQSVVAYVKIKVLVEAKVIDFEPRHIRELDKEFKNQRVKIDNIIHLSKVNAMTADAYQKEQIERTLKKNEAFLEAFDEEIKELNKRMEKEPELYMKVESKEQKSKEEKPREEDKSAVQRKGSPFSLEGMLSARKNQREVEERLKEEEKKNARTMCVEIPFYDKSLSYTECYVCKDIPTYSILKRKNNVFFGMSKNVDKGTYHNGDMSLVELTQVTDEFLQFMTEDLLSGEYDLKPFTKDEKKSLQMYFNFISHAFEKNIGVTLTVMEYMNFKQYYNRLIMTMFDLEEKFRRDYYRALTLADTYTSYMECYGLSYSDEKRQIVKNIMEEKSRNYVDDLELLMSHHIVEKRAKDMLQDLIQRIRYFSDEKLFEENGKVESIAKNEVEAVHMRMQPTRMSGFIDITPESVDPAIGFMAEDYNDGVIITADDLSHIQIKIQFQNKERVIVDEALFTVANVKRAVYDYLNREAFIKKIGLYINGKDVFLYSSKNGSLSVAVLTEQMKRIKKLNQGTQGELIEFYEEKIRKTMIEFTE
ncbi:MAG: hypothetical protein U0L79_05800 [Lachnospiraceae bacterium]|nr:hypothetical protein [Lachnospiraceae bacterium]